MTTETETRPPAPPTFPFRAYGVNLTTIGEEGEIMAEGHVQPSRFLAACNRMARTVMQCRNLADSKEATLEEALDVVRHAWALPVHDPYPDDDEKHEWWVRYDSSVTAETAGAIPVTLWEPW